MKIPFFFFPSSPSSAAYMANNEWERKKRCMSRGRVLHILSVPNSICVKLL